MFIAIMSTLSERLKQARQHAGLTQDELAEKSGVTQASISKIELGKNKSENTTFGVQLAVACGVRCEWLVLGMGEMLEGLKPDEAAKAKRDLQLQTAAAIALRLKRATKDPAAFELTALVVKPDGAACYEYRAKNSYGAILPSSAVLTAKGKVLLQEHDGNTFVSAWNKACVPPGGDEIAAIVTRTILK